MINKYTGLTLVLLAVISLFASWYVYKKYSKNFYVSTGNTYESRQLIKDIEIKPEAFASLSVMKNVANKLSATTPTDEINVSLAFSPTSNKEERPVLTVPTDAELQRRKVASICRQAKNLRVSMSFVSESEEYAVIADKFVKKGQVVDNNFKVLEIHNDTIKVQKQGVNCEIKVNTSRISQL